MKNFVLVLLVISSSLVLSSDLFQRRPQPGPGGLLFSNHSYTPRQLGDRFVVAYATVVPAFYAACRKPGPIAPAFAAMTGIIASHLLVRAKNSFDKSDPSFSDGI